MTIAAVCAAALLGTAVTGGLLAATTQARSEPPRVPFSHSLGKLIFDDKCAQCHGTWGDGSDKGPPLMHGYYVPSHHSDQSFYRAIVQGSRQHHWGFGDMQPVPGLKEGEIAKVIEYVRWLQKERGIIH